MLRNVRAKEKVIRSRLFSAAEVALGAFLVIGHNVFRVVPNEVLILFVLGMISAWLRNGRLSAIGLKRPESWRRIVLIALAAAALREVLGEYVVLPIAEQFWPDSQLLPEGAGEIRGNISYALLVLLFVWTFAALGEEIGYRGYLITRTADLGRSSQAAYMVGVLVAAVLFGYGHYYKGPAGIIDSGLAGLIFGLAYVLAGRNLWAAILAHGFIDTYGVIVLYFGWAD